MIEQGNLSRFNQTRIRDISECTDDVLVSLIFKEKKSFPLIYLLLTQTTEFYSQNFPDLQAKIKREKRLVVFETPSRVQMTHEYTIEDSGNMKHGFYFLFNATKRLSWLKVYLEGTRISIASKDKVVLLLKDKLVDELQILESFLKEEKDIIVRRLYDLSDGKPCFVEFNQKIYRGQQSLLLSLTFFDSIQNKKLFISKRIMSPLKEKVLIYNYNTLSPTASSWIYFKAPSNFVLNVQSNARKSEIEKSDSNDEEISSFVLTPNGKRLDTKFDICVNVPNALSFWYKTIFYSSIFILCATVFLFVLSFVYPMGKAIIEITTNISFAMVAALIATRGWLISEEQVMKTVSNFYAILVTILLAMSLGLTITSNCIQHDISVPSFEVPGTLPEIVKDSVYFRDNDSLGLIQNKINTK